MGICGDQKSFLEVIFWNFQNMRLIGGLGGAKMPLKSWFFGQLVPSNNVLRSSKLFYHNLKLETHLLVSKPGLCDIVLKN